MKVGPSKLNLVLSPSDYVTSGGEGSIYVQGKMVYKILDPSKPKPYLEGKIQLLSVLKHRAIVAPRDVLYDKIGDVVGYSMPYVKGEAMVRYFTNDFRNQQNYGDKETLQAVHVMKDINSSAHAAGALIVDGNEMNYLCDNHGDVVIIDVDSWQIGSYKATAIMASIRDYHSQSFSELTDWFSWGIVSFQLFTGIHPFKGRHPKYKPGSWVERMKANISVFDKDVILPAAVRPLVDIPPNLAAWYEAAFQTGERQLPPDNFDVLAKPKVMQRTVYKSGGSLVFTKLREFPEIIVRVFPNGVVLTKDRLPRENHIHTSSGGPGVSTGGIDVKHCINTEVGVVISDDMPNSSVFVLGGGLLKIPLQYKKMFSSNNRLFAVTEAGITELIFRKLAKSMCLMGDTWALNPNSTKFEEGAAIYDALGAHYVMLPYEKGTCNQHLLDPLKGKTLITAKAIDNFVTCLVKENSGQNFKVEAFLPRVADSWSEPRLWSGPTDENELNFTMNQRGIVTTIVEDGELTLFSPHSGQSKVIKDRHIATDMKLVRYESNIAFYKDNELWSLSTT